MTRDWQPGDPIPHGDHTVTFTWNEEAIEAMLRVLREGYPSGHRSMATAVATALRGSPLVVIDPEDREQVERLTEQYKASYYKAELREEPASNARNLEVRTGAMQDALRSLLAPPKPDEPTGLGAVVKDEDGDAWVRFKTAERAPWRLNNHGDVGLGTFYRDIQVVRVLSEGVVT